MFRVRDPVSGEYLLGVIYNDGGVESHWTAVPEVARRYESRAQAQRVATDLECVVERA